MPTPQSHCIPAPETAPDDGTLNILDFLTFQLLWQANDPAADCNEHTAFDITDFTCYQQRFAAGCP